jgi:hypothetical protein
MSSFLARNKSQSSQICEGELQVANHHRYRKMTNKAGNAMPAIQSSAVIGKNEDGSDITQDVDVLVW